MAIPKIESNAKPKKIVFDDDGEIVSEAKQKSKNKKEKSVKNTDAENVDAVKDEDDAEIGDFAEEEEDDYFSMREKKKSKQKNDNNEKESETQKKWYYIYPQYPATEEILDMKDNDQMELYNICRSSYDQEKAIFLKQNPSDSRWLQTALHKGTAKDRANAGALLVTSNPLANLEALSTLIGFTKISNKSSAEVISIVTDLWKEVLLPPNRKLYSLQMRGADWKLVRKDTNLTKEQQRKIYAYWHFENELKDQYFEFLKNIQQGIQTGQDNNKTVSILTASQLLSFAPEKEQMLLTMLINKLGDPVAKIASKALHHLSDVAHRHPNMCGVIVNETEKLLFRNNISERAQHFALCYLSSIAPAGRPEVCTKLVHICFSLFKVLVQKGAINNRTMQAILRCLQKAILEAKPASGSTELLSKEMQDTIYRLVHLADIRVSIQTLGLLLQLVSVKTEKSDRFYNALYIKLVDMNLTTIGTKCAAQLLHIVHRAIFIDTNLARAQAFVKRLLQLALCMPSNMAAGCLIVIHKLLRSRKELCPEEESDTTGGNAVKVSVTDEELSKFDSDGEEKYDDVVDTNDGKIEENPDTGNVESSWHHSKVAPCEIESKVREMNPSKYDPYHRVPAFAGAEYCLRNELILLREHFHPTVQVFAESILNNKRIDYYGDPLRDFGLPHFLERFSFKNPKKLDQEKSNVTALGHKHYISYGPRGMPVKNLTRNNCSEEEMFIFNYLEQKRKQSVVTKPKTEDEEDDEESPLKTGDVDDDEFEQYLDGFFGKKSSKAEKHEADAEELDFLKEFEDVLGADAKQSKGKAKKKLAADEEDNMEDIDADWGDDDDDDKGSDLSMDEDGSIDLNQNEDGDEDDDDQSISMDEFEDNEDEPDHSSDSDIDADDDDDEPKHKKSKKDALSDMNERNFAKKLKHSDDMSSLFAAADDFAELLEETGKTKGQGTLNAVFNADKSSEKQLQWEEQRRSNTKSYKNKSKPSGGKMFSKKRKH
ncbi:CCAAT/enhancer-binding protein zeta [Calliphora vicina]|uniref:CCAAT/enhancer-binding protein zeta n=1 Tax=Calliphora vicina TaxID=7373 RepID=UPI00325BC632